MKSPDMTETKPPVTIKKYANRRLYDTGSSAYVTLEDLASMVKAGRDFEVFDAKSGEDITRSVLAQIIFEQEAKDGQSMLPVAVMRQLIRFYGDSLQSLVPSYLEFSMGRFATDQQKFRENMGKAIGGSSHGGPAFGSLEEITRTNMDMFTKALALFNPFAAMQQAGKAAEAAGNGAKPAPASAPADIEVLRRELGDMQSRLEKLGAKKVK